MSNSKRPELWDRVKLTENWYIRTITAPIPEIPIEGVITEIYQEDVHVNGATGPICNLNLRLNSAQSIEGVRLNEIEFLLRA